MGGAKIILNLSDRHSIDSGSARKFSAVAGEPT
jgi:hypothetical protein